MVKEMFWYDEGKARGFAKDLSAMVKKELEKSSNSLGPNINNNSSVQNKRVGDNQGNNSHNIASNTNIMITNNNNNVQNSNTLHHPGNNILLSNNSNVFSSSGQ